VAIVAHLGNEILDQTYPLTLRVSIHFFSFWSLPAYYILDLSMISDSPCVPIRVLVPVDDSLVVDQLY